MNVEMNRHRQICRRTTGTPRAFFDTKEEAAAFSKDPRNIAYHGDMAHECTKCGRVHLSRPEWLSVPFNEAQPMMFKN